MSKRNSANCVLVGPGHNLPLEIELDGIEVKRVEEAITYLGNGVFRLGQCKCTGWRDKVSHTEFNLQSGEFTNFPYDGQRADCQELFTVHNAGRLSEMILRISSTSFVELDLGYERTRVLRYDETGETFWLKGNDGSVAEKSNVIVDTRVEFSGCSISRVWERKLIAPAISPCISSDGTGFHEEF
jgi:hypothetical protein